jgi:hypothetical protein
VQAQRRLDDPLQEVTAAARAIRTITHVPFPCHQDTLAAGGACSPS